MAEKKKDAGAVWKKTGARGEYLSGIIEIEGTKVGFKAFPNDYKQKENHPDYRIYLDTPRPVAKWDPPKETMTEEDIPF